MLKKTIAIFLLLVFPLCLYSNSVEDEMLKKNYSILPKTASNIKVVNKSETGDFIEYYDKGRQWAFINKNGSLKDVKKDVFSSLADVFDIEYDKVNIVFNGFNLSNQAVGYVLYFGINFQYFPFFWSHRECVILPKLSENSSVAPAMALSINNHGIIVGYDYKKYEQTFYIGVKKAKKKLLCRGIVPVIWPNTATIKEICLFSDKNINLSYLNDSIDRPHFVSIDDDNFIHFWFDISNREYSGSVHMNEL